MPVLVVVVFVFVEAIGMFILSSASPVPNGHRMAASEVHGSLFYAGLMGSQAEPEEAASLRLKGPAGLLLQPLEILKTCNLQALVPTAGILEDCSLKSFNPTYTLELLVSFG